MGMCGIYGYNKATCIDGSEGLQKPTNTQISNGLYAVRVFGDTYRNIAGIYE
jgi:hypothetical protein